MKKFLSIFLMAIVLFSFNAIADDVKLPEVKYSSLDDKLPMNPEVKHGTLDNGLKYYIMENHKPANRAELQIVFMCGSVLEEDDQAGLAHFSEHMCFNGTKNFPKAELVSFLEKTGMRFGADVNANTGFDRTYYMLTIPLDSAGMLENGFQVLEDWASNVSFDPEEIEKERGVIMEEWRVYRGANQRVMKTHFPNLLKGSKYADRLPIGDTAVILHAPRERFMDLYTNFYRPNLTAVIAVGDFDGKKIEKIIKERFSKLKNPANAKERKEYKIPIHKERIVSIATDKELPMAQVQMYIKHPGMDEGTYRTYRDNIVHRIIGQMLSMRMQELSQSKEPPFLAAGGGFGNFLGDIASFSLVSIPKAEGNGIINGFEAALKEAYRACQHGFTKTELDRTKEAMLTNMESALKEKDKTESKAYAMECGRNFIEDEGMPGIAYEVALYKKFLPEITIDEVNKVMKSYIKDEGVVVAVSAPEAEGIIVPKEDEILAKIDEVKAMKLEPYVDKVSDKPLFDKELTPGTITSEKKYDKADVKEFTLSNGVRVIYKTTDFKNDEILVRAYSPGGYSNATDDIYLSAEFADAILNNAGIADFTDIELQKMLTGKLVSIAPSIGELTEGFRGMAAPKDFEILMQLVHLYFTNPRLDYDAFDSFISKQKDALKNRDKDPQNALRDTIRVTMSNYHKRERPLTADMLENVDPDDAYDFFRNRYADAGDFTFIFVGNIDEKQLKDFAKKYLATLPTTGRKENWKDLGVKAPKNKLEKKVFKGQEKKSTVYLTMRDDFKYTPENKMELHALVEVLRIQLREAIREEKRRSLRNWRLRRYKPLPE